MAAYVPKGNILFARQTTILDKSFRVEARGQIEVVVRPDPNVQVSNNLSLFEIGDPGGWGKLQTNNLGQPVFSVYDPNAPPYGEIRRAAAPITLLNDRCYGIVCQWKETYIRIFVVDGNTGGIVAEADTPIGGTSTTNTSVLRIGGDMGSAHWVGWLQNFRVWPVVRTDEGTLSDVFETLPDGLGIYRYYPLDEGGGEAVFDRSDFRMVATLAIGSGTWVTGNGTGCVAVGSEPPPPTAPPFYSDPFTLPSCPAGAIAVEVAHGNCDPVVMAAVVETPRASATQLYRLDYRIYNPSVSPEAATWTLLTAETDPIYGFDKRLLTEDVLYQVRAVRIGGTTYGYSDPFSVSFAGLVPARIRLNVAIYTPVARPDLCIQPPRRRLDA